MVLASDSIFGVVTASSYPTTAAGPNLVAWLSAAVTQAGANISDLKGIRAACIARLPVSN